MSVTLVTLLLGIFHGARQGAQPPLRHVAADPLVLIIYHLMLLSPVSVCEIHIQYCNLSRNLFFFKAGGDDDTWPQGIWRKAPPTRDDRRSAEHAHASVANSCPEQEHDRAERSRSDRRCQGRRLTEHVTLETDISRSYRACQVEHNMPTLDRTCRD